MENTDFNLVEVDLSVINKRVKHGSEKNEVRTPFKKSLQKRQSAQNVMKNSEYDD